MKKQLNLLLAILMSASLVVTGALSINDVMAGDGGTPRTEQEKIMEELKDSQRKQEIKDEIESLKKDLELFQKSTLVEEAEAALKKAEDSPKAENVNAFHEAVNKVVQAASKLYTRALELKSKIEKEGRKWADVTPEFVGLMDTDGQPIIYISDGKRPLDFRPAAAESQPAEDPTARPTCAHDDAFVSLGEIVAEIHKRNNDKDKDSKAETHEEERSPWPYVIAGGINALGAAFAGYTIHEGRRTQRRNLKRIDGLELLSVAQGRNPIDLQRLRYLEMGRNDYLQFGLQGVARGTQGVLDAVMAYQNPKAYAYMITNRHKWDTYADMRGGRYRSDNGYGGRFSMQGTQDETRTRTTRFDASDNLARLADAFERGLRQPIQDFRQILGGFRQSFGSAEERQRTTQEYQRIVNSLKAYTDMSAKLEESLDTMEKMADLMEEQIGNAGPTGRQGGAQSGSVQETWRKTSEAERSFRRGRR